VRRRVLVVAGMAVALALASGAVAGEKRKGKGKGKAQRVTGTFVSAEVAGEKVNWKITTDEDQAEKTFEMAAKVVVMYMERKGQNRAMQIRALGKKVPEAKGKRLVAQGTVEKAELQGNQLTVTVKLDAGESKPFLLGAKLTVAYREKGDGSLAALGIGSARRGKKGEGRQKGEGRKRKKKDANAPDNM